MKSKKGVLPIIIFGLAFFSLLLVFVTGGQFFQIFSIDEDKYDLNRIVFVNGRYEVDRPGVTFTNPQWGDLAGDLMYPKSENFAKFTNDKKLVNKGFTTENLKNNLGNAHAFCSEYYNDTSIGAISQSLGECDASKDPPGFSFSGEWRAWDKFNNVCIITEVVCRTGDLYSSGDLTQKEGFVMDADYDLFTITYDAELNGGSIAPILKYKNKNYNFKNGKLSLQVEKGDEVFINFLLLTTGSQTPSLAPNYDLTPSNSETGETLKISGEVNDYQEVGFIETILNVPEASEPEMLETIESEVKKGIITRFFDFIKSLFN